MAQAESVPGWKRGEGGQHLYLSGIPALWILVTPLVRFHEGRGGQLGQIEILWHRRETRRPKEKTNLNLTPGSLLPTRERRHFLDQILKTQAWKFMQRLTK